MDAVGIPGVSFCSDVRLPMQEMRAEEAEGDPHNTGKSKRGRLVRRNDPAPVVVQRDADSPEPEVRDAVEVAHVKTASPERESPIPRIDRGPSLETRGLAVDAEIQVHRCSPHVVYDPAPNLDPTPCLPPPPVAQPYQPPAPPTPPQQIVVAPPLARVPISIESAAMGRHRLRVDVFSVSDTIVIIGYDLDADNVMVEPPPCTSEAPLTVKYKENSYQCACYGFSTEARIAGRNLLLLVLVRV